MTATDIVERLAAHRALGAAPREELTWLATHGSIRELNAGHVLTAKDRTIEGLFVVLSGRITISVDRGGGSGPRMIMEWRGGDVTGVLPYSRAVNPPGDTRAQEPTVVRLLPLEVVEEKAASESDLLPLYEFEPETEQVLDALLPRYIESRIFAAMLQAAASELAARQRAMKSAGDNATDLIKKYTRLRNTARQAEITQELSEIVAGADALSAS